jgi:uncharacterized protein YaiI (UPF0178 family)
VTIFVDADSCPRKARALILRAALRRGVPSVFAANRKIPGLPKTSLVRMALCSGKEDAADDYIVERARKGDIAVTRDVPFAARLVEKSVTVMNDRGRLFTRENIRYYVSLRNVALELAQNNLGPERNAAYGAKALKMFAAEFDKQLSRLVRETAADEPDGKSLFKI